LLGAQLLFDLAKAGKKVRALRRATSSNYTLNLVFSEQPTLLNQIEWIEGDVTDIPSLLIAMDGIEEIYHCAAYVSFQPGDYQKLMKVNVEGTANMVNIALEKGVKKFCHVSSVAALGRMEENKPIDESAIWKESKINAAYAISKYASEREVWRGIEEGLNAVIINPSIIIGAGDWKSGSSQMFTQVWKGLRFYTDGVTGFVDAGDVSKCMMQLMERNILGERFIISSENLSFRSVIGSIATQLNKPKPSIRATAFLREIAWRAEAVRKFFTGHLPLITKETARTSEHKWYPSNEKIKKTLGIEFISVEESIARTAKIFLKSRQLG